VRRFSYSPKSFLASLHVSFAHSSDKSHGSLNNILWHLSGKITRQFLRSLYKIVPLSTDSRRMGVHFPFSVCRCSSKPFVCASSIWPVVDPPETVCSRAHVFFTQNLWNHWSNRGYRCFGLLLIHLHSLTLQQSCRSSKAEPNFIFTWNCVPFLFFLLFSLLFFPRSPSIFHGSEFGWREVWEAVKIILWQLTAKSDESDAETPLLFASLSLFYPFCGKAVVLNLVLSRFHIDLQHGRHSFSVSTSEETLRLKTFFTAFKILA
jgi:hypothetical protein